LKAEPIIVTSLTSNVQENVVIPSEYKFLSYVALAGTQQIYVVGDGAILYVSTTNQYPTSASSYNYSSPNGGCTISIDVPIGGETYFIGLANDTSVFTSSARTFGIVVSSTKGSFYMSDFA
jgi:hypothetical protein